MPRFLFDQDGSDNDQTTIQAADHDTSVHQFEQPSGRSRLGCLGLTIVVLLLVALGVRWFQASTDDKGSRNGDQPAASEQPDAPETSGDIEVNVDPASLKEVFEGEVRADELAFGEEALRLMADADQERGPNAHSDKTHKTPKQLTGWLNNPDDPKAVPVRERVASAIANECGPDDVKVHLEDSQGWLPTVVKPASQVWGTSYMAGGLMGFVHEWRQGGLNDAYWLPVCTQGPNKGKVVANGMVRADCGNGHENPKIRIVRLATPPAPSVECAINCVPPPPPPPTTVPKVTPPASPPPTTPRVAPPPTAPSRAKDPSKDINRNPSVPAQVRKTGPSPDNQQVVSRPPSRPVDSPTGCNGPCPTTSPAPSSGGSSGGNTNDSGSGATNTTSPPTTAAPPPAPPNTSSPSAPIDSP